MGPAVAARTVEIDLPAQTTLDQAIVALLQLRRGQVPGDATLDQPAVLRSNTPPPTRRHLRSHHRRTSPPKTDLLALEADPGFDS